MESLLDQCHATAKTKGIEFKITGMTSFSIVELSDGSFQKTAASAQQEEALMREALELMGE